MKDDYNQIGLTIGQIQAVISFYLRAPLLDKKTAHTDIQLRGKYVCDC